MIIRLTEKIVEETKIFNEKLQKKAPFLEGFRWPHFMDMIPEIMLEQVRWVKFLADNDVPEYNKSSRHAFAVANRIKNKWTLGEKRNDARKEDPWLLPLSACPDYIQEWCHIRTDMTEYYVKQYLFQLKMEGRVYVPA